jgi:hypothetical protein
MSKLVIGKDGVHEEKYGKGLKGNSPEWLVANQLDAKIGLRNLYFRESEESLKKAELLEEDIEEYKKALKLLINSKEK